MKTVQQSGFALFFAITMAALLAAMPAVGKTGSKHKDADCNKPSCITYLEGLERAYQENPDDPYILIQLGRAYQQEGNTQQALIYMDRYLSLRPTDYRLAIEAARMAMSIPNWSLAEKTLNQAISSAPDPDPLRKEMGMLYLKQDLIDKASEIYMDLLAKYPEDAEINGNLGLIYLKTKDLEKAISHLHKAAEREPGSSDRQNMLGLVYIQSGEIEDAAKAFQKAIRLAPNNIIYHYNLGEAYRLSGLQSQAVSEYDYALQGTPTTADEYFNQGKVGYRLGLYEDAIKKYTIALEKFQDPAAKAQVYMGMGLTYEIMNQPELARHAYGKFLELVPAGETSETVRNRIKSL
jgi:tetratricopeptide (TPR) repeat protein